MKQKIELLVKIGDETFRVVRANKNHCIKCPSKKRIACNRKVGWMCLGMALQRKINKLMAHGATVVKV